MAFTLQIRQKKLFGKTVLDIPSLAHACGFCYGSNDDFYILQEKISRFREQQFFIILSA